MNSYPISDEAFSLVRLKHFSDELFEIGEKDFVNEVYSLNIASKTAKKIADILEKKLEDRIGVVVKSLSEKYKEYKDNQSDYVLLRKSLLQDPEEALSKASDALNIAGLRSEVAVLLRKEIEEAKCLYGELYDGSPTNEDVERFIEVSGSILLYEDFITASQLKAFKLCKELVEAYRDIE